MVQVDGVSRGSGILVGVVLSKNENVIKFVDFCAGLGGFHHALSQAAETIFKTKGLKVELECVAAAEIEDDLRDCYAQNFPDVVESYASHHRPLVESATLQFAAAGDDKLRNALPIFNENGVVTRVHGDLFVFLNEEVSGLRTLKNGERLLPKHDLLCAGFPCQPFSKSGAQKGFEDTRGTVFHALATITREVLPAFLLLENVGNFPRHDNGNTWRRVKAILHDLGYDVAATEPVSSGPKATGLLSPHHVGYPHHRERFFIFAQRRKALISDSSFISSLLGAQLSERDPTQKIGRTLEEGHLNKMNKKAHIELIRIISQQKCLNEKTELRAAQLSADHTRCINHWGKLLDRLKEHDKESGLSKWRDSMPSFPIWGYELDPWNWYPIDVNPADRLNRIEEVGNLGNTLLRDATAHVKKATAGRVNLRQFPPGGNRAWLRRPLGIMPTARWIESWPRYAASRSEWPAWKVRFITQNREWALLLWSTLDPLWLRAWLDELYEVISVPSLQKLEWNCKGEELNIWSHILQFRPSGLRVKRLAHVPALVAMTTTQIPIVPCLNNKGTPSEVFAGAKARHLLPSEALQLQGFPANWHHPKSRERAFTCFGNAVHAGLVKDVMLNWFFPDHLQR